MGAKKRNKPASAPKKRNRKTTRAHSRSAPRKAAAKKAKPDTVLPVLNSDKLKELYATMVKCRILAERIGDTTKNKAGLVLPGFEATLVGAGAHLFPQDCIALERGSFIASFIKGTPLSVIVARSQASKKNNGTGISAPLTAAAALLNMSTGLTLAKGMQGKGAVTLIFCTHDGESLVFDPDIMATAATQKLPFVCFVERGFQS